MKIADFQIHLTHLKWEWVGHPRYWYCEFGIGHIMVIRGRSHDA